jgi:hypothetical protein
LDAVAAGLGFAVTVLALAAAAGFDATLDFAAGFGLEAAAAGLDAALDFDGALAMNSATPRMLVRSAAGPAPAASSIRHDNGV